MKVAVKALALCLIFSFGALAQAEKREHKKNLSTEEIVEKKMTHLTETLDLTAEQVPQVRKIIEQQLAQKEAARKMMEQQREKTKAEMEKVLTPQQAEKMEAMHKKHHKRELKHKRRGED